MAYPTCLKLGKRKANSERSTYIYFLSRTAEGERAQGGVSSCLDPPRSSEGFLTAPPSGDVTPTAPHEQALVSLETAISQQVHQPIAELLLADSHADSLEVLARAVPQLSAPDRPNCEAEASQMEMSPASTGGERGGGAAALDTVRDGKLTIKAFIFLVCLLKYFLRMKSVLYLIVTYCCSKPFTHFQECCTPSLLCIVYYSYGGEFYYLYSQCYFDHWVFFWFFFW